MMPDTQTPTPGASLPCEPMPTAPWVVFILPGNATAASKWVPVARFRRRNEAWQHVEQLKKLISTAYFDVVFEQEHAANA